AEVLRLRVELGLAENVLEGAEVELGPRVEPIRAGARRTGRRRDRPVGRRRCALLVVGAVSGGRLTGGGGCNHERKTVSTHGYTSPVPALAGVSKEERASLSRGHVCVPRHMRACSPVDREIGALRSEQTLASEN